MTWIVAQLGARTHYVVPGVLHEAGLLERFYTDVYADNALLRLLRHWPVEWRPSSLRRLLGRVAARLPRGRVVSYPVFGVMYYVRRSLAADREALGKVHLWAGAEFGRLVVRNGFGGAHGVYAFNTAALEILASARERGIFSVLEQTSAPRLVERELVAEEGARFPGWEVQGEIAGEADETAKREIEEWSLADVILCGSHFVRNGIARCGGPVERCVVVPYGVDSSVAAQATRHRSGRLRVLTVGQVCLQKGAPYAMQAARMLRGMVEFRWVGQVKVTNNARKQMAEDICLVGIVPRTEIAAHYEWADVFFLPSVCEGSAVVTYEALSRGLPVVTTTHSGSVVRDGLDGFIVPVGDATVMAARLREMHENRTLLAHLAAGAREGAGKVSLAAYRERLLEALNVCGT